MKQQPERPAGLTPAPDTAAPDKPDKPDEPDKVRRRGRWWPRRDREPKAPGPAAVLSAGVRAVRSGLGLVVLLTGLVLAVVLGLGVLFVLLDANRKNTVVHDVLDASRTFVGPFEDMFRLHDRDKTEALNWAVAAVAYLVAGKLGQRVIGGRS